MKSRPGQGLTEISKKIRLKQNDHASRRTQRSPHTLREQHRPSPSPTLSASSTAQAQTRASPSGNAQTKCPMNDKFTGHSQKVEPAAYGSKSLQSVVRKQRVHIATCRTAARLRHGAFNTTVTRDIRTCGCIFRSNRLLALTALRSGRADQRPV